jgi:hypothetical protein
VTVTGSGWLPGHLIGFCEGVPAPGQPPSQSDCAQFPNTTTADANGDFTGFITIARLVTVRGQLFDCAAPSAPCVIGAADAFDIAATGVRQPLQFASVPPIILPGSAEVTEGESGTTILPLPATLSFASTQTVTADWATDQSFCQGPPADPGTDFTVASGTVTFAPGDTSVTMPISVHGDTQPEPDECVAVLLSNPTNATIGLNPLAGVAAQGTIQNDDFLTPDLVIKRRSDGVMFFDNEYTQTPSAYLHALTPGASWTYAIIIQNDGNTTGDLVVQVQESTATSPFDVQYFFGYYDVTSAVEGDGLVVPAMTPGESRLFAVRFSAAADTPSGATAEIVMRARSEPENVSFGDALRLRVIAS